MVWRNSNLLHNSQWIPSPTQSYLVCAYFVLVCASFLGTDSCLFTNISIHRSFFHNITYHFVIFTMFISLCHIIIISLTLSLSLCLSFSLILHPCSVSRGSRIYRQLLSRGVSLPVSNEYLGYDSKQYCSFGG